LAVDDFLLFKVFRVLEVDDFPKLLFKIENWKVDHFWNAKHHEKKPFSFLPLFKKLISLCSLSGDRKM
jgi:hypothetical protein